MKIEDLIPKLLEFNKKVKWEPNYTSKNYDSWIENLKDNGITRQRYWGCPVPIWMCSCGEIEVIGSIDELRKNYGKPLPDLHKPWIDEVKFKCKKCKKEMRRIPDVIDVWIDAGTASWNCLDFPRNKKNMNLWPADFILEATEQIKLWFSMLQICSGVAFGKSCYNNVYCHGMILDYQGTKMSKSLGNIISPYEVVDKYGADVLRYYICETPAGENINFNWETVKIKQKNLEILYNLSKFILDLKKQTKTKKSLDIEEKFIISMKNSTIEKVTSLLENYRLDEVIREIEGLFLALSRTYIKFTREKVNSKNAGKVLYAVEDVYRNVLRMFSIVCPFITEHLYRKTFGEESVHLCAWPKPDKKKIDKNLEQRFGLMMKIVEAGLFTRDKIQIGLKWPLAKATINCGDFKLKNVEEEIIKNQLNVKQLLYKESANKKEIGVDFDTNMTPELEAEGYAREASRQIQAYRKQLGLEKKNKIELYLVVNEDFKKILEKQKKFIKERTGARIFEIVTTDKERFKNKTSFKIKEKSGEIAIVLK